ncbi:uncharacterized protein LOC120111319 [Phoenix dactylifera]|uniref:Uncharacterized protein LOC120111319 n=1 Tax=Phoenix dactylifera TaxID=42345 RepID=A0A8B9ABH2_PHODC|nr:uncharacterized protein LOC120111319 [Phoenix dactylifera]
MASPPTSLSLHEAPFLQHIRRFPPPPPPPRCRPTCAIHSLPETPQRPSVEPDGLDRRQILEKFRYTSQIGHGWLEIRHMKDEDLDAVALLLAESFNRDKQSPGGNISMFAFVVKQYMIERRSVIPHAAVLVGFYKEKDGEEAQLACTAEISFDALGAHPAVGTPRPPKECPYIGNVSVTKTLRRKGIGLKLLKACEKLIIQMKAERKVYLHCRVASKGPFRLYEKAGYKVVKKDSILTWLFLKRRRYLMFKELPPIADDENESDVSDCN